MRHLNLLGQMVDQTALYAVLGLTPGSDRAAVRDAYRALARQLHPDVNRSADAPERMCDLNAAYDALRNLPSHSPSASPQGTPASRASRTASPSPSVPFGGFGYQVSAGGAVSIGSPLFVPINGITIGIVAGFVGLVTLFAVWAFAVTKPGVPVTVSQSRAATAPPAVQSTTNTLAAQASANAAANAAAARSNLNSGSRSEVAGISMVSQVPAGASVSQPSVTALMENVSSPLAAQAPEVPVIAPLQTGAPVQSPARSIQPSVQPAIPAVPASRSEAAQHITAVTGQPSLSSSDAAGAQAATRALSAYDKAWTAYAGSLRFAAAGSMASSAANAASAVNPAGAGAARLTAMSPASLMSSDAQLTMARTAHFQQQLAWNTNASAALTAASAANLTITRPDPTKAVRADQRLRQAAELVSQTGASSAPLNISQLKPLLDEAEQLHRESVAEWARLLAAL